MTLVSRWWLESVLDRFRLWHVRVDGIEVTQAIQHYKASRHLTDPADRGMDNSVQLVSGKAAWVRVYVRSGLLAEVAGLTGTLTIERREHGFLYTPVATLAPRPPGTVTARSAPDYATERGSVANTLNFIIPSDTMAGTMRLTVRITDSAGEEFHTRSVIVSATLQQTLRLRGIMVSYNGPSTSSPPPGTTPPTLNLAAPTLANLQATSALSLRLMPVRSTGNFTSAGTIAWTMPLDDARTGAGGCSANWGQLMTTLLQQRTNDGNRTDVVYYGLLPAGIPLNVPGCGNAGLGAAASGDQNTLLHEIGHGYGFAHTPCGNVGTPDPNYPTYEPYAAASIGEYGLDISNGTVLSPQTARDYMSYCGPAWMSLYQHSRLIGHDRLDPQWSTDFREWLDYRPWYEYVIPELWLPNPPPFDAWRIPAMKMNPVIALTGMVHGPDRVEVTSVARVNVMGEPPGTPTDLTAQLLNEAGEPVARAAVHRMPVHGCCGCEEGERAGRALPYAFQAFIPDVEPGAALSITDGENAVWERRASSRPPVVRGAEAEVVSEDQLELRWSVEGDAERAEVWVQWSQPEHPVWRGLATGLGGEGATVSLAGVADGDVLVRVLVHDGFFTTASEAVPIRVPARRPVASILHPREGQRLQAGGTLHLWASASDSAGAPIEDEMCSWQLNERDVGRGREVWLTAPPPGDHRVTLRVRGPGGERQETVTFRTASPDEDAREGMRPGSAQAQ